jgi:hypothetical protein
MKSKQKLPLEVGVMIIATVKLDDAVFLTVFDLLVDDSSGILGLELGLMMYYSVHESFIVY